MPPRPAAVRRSRSASGPEAWPPWSGPLALLAAIVVASIAVLAVDIPAVILGVRVTSSHIPPGLVNLDTFVQDAVFVLVALFFAQLGGRAIAASQFGLRPTRFWSSVGLIVLAIALFLIF